jgi:hypothetical protein
MGIDAEAQGIKYLLDDDYRDSGTLYCHRQTAEEIERAAVERFVAEVDALHTGDLREIGFAYLRVCRERRIK